MLRQKDRSGKHLEDASGKVQAAVMAIANKVADSDLDHGTGYRKEKLD